MKQFECSKKDWALFRNKIAVWQENYINKLNKEYIELLSGDESASEKFWKLEERIKRDRKHPGVIIQMRKSEMIYDIAILMREGVIGTQDLEGFSEELIEHVQVILGKRFD